MPDGLHFTETALAPVPASAPVCCCRASLGRAGRLLCGRLRGQLLLRAAELHEPQLRPQHARLQAGRRRHRWLCHHPGQACHRGLGRKSASPTSRRASRTMSANPCWKTTALRAAAAGAELTSRLLARPRCDMRTHHNNLMKILPDITGSHSARQRLQRMMLPRTFGIIQ